MQSPLHLAVLTHQSKIVRQLVVAGANAEARDRFGNTPLHLACQNGHNQSCRELLMANCNPDIQNNVNKLIFIYAFIDLLISDR